MQSFKRWLPPSVQMCIAAKQKKNKEPLQVVQTCRSLPLPAALDLNLILNSASLLMNKHENPKPFWLLHKPHTAKSFCFHFSATRLANKMNSNCNWKALKGQARWILLITTWLSSVSHLLFCLYKRPQGQPEGCLLMVQKNITVCSRVCREEQM